MKHIYIINQFHLKEKAPLLIEKLETVSKQLHRDYEICVNATPEDVKKTLSAFKTVKTSSPVLAVTDPSIYCSTT